MFYSPSKNEFSAYQAGDSIFIDDDICFALMSQKSNGYYIVPVNGYPTAFLKDPLLQPPTQEQQDAERLGIDNYKALIRREADALDAAGEPYKALKLLKTIGE